MGCLQTLSSQLLLLKYGMSNNNSEIAVYWIDPGRKCFYRPYDENDYVSVIPRPCRCKSRRHFQFHHAPSTSHALIQLYIRHVTLCYIKYVICYILSLVEVQKLSVPCTAFGHFSSVHTIESRHSYCDKNSTEQYRLQQKICFATPQACNTAVYCITLPVSN